jgi:hypothetical protein
MRVLLDTNVLIFREDHSVVPAQLQSLLRILNTLRATLVLHPGSLQDINRDPEGRRREIVKSKIMTPDGNSRHQYSSCHSPLGIKPSFVRCG